MSFHHSGSVSSFGSNKFFSSSVCVGIGDPGPSTPCAVGNAAAGICGVAIFAASCAVMTRPDASTPAKSPPSDVPASLAISAARPRESIRTPSASSESDTAFACVYAMAAAVAGFTTTGATNTFNVFPTSSRPFNCDTASIACCVSLYCTCAPPLWSLSMVMKSVSPNGSNTALRSSSRTFGWTPSTRSLHGPAVGFRFGFIAGSTVVASFCSSRFVACSASHAMFFSASDDFTITTWFRSV
mmetsp:Transcript_177253/g.431170  ORF Transcript_177253/g.431170 Transcript_177253/m.431170 type:complete len:242 (-) Transcript_177253:312-1037(-)